jgi:hypothetical protein
MDGEPDDDAVEQLSKEIATRGLILQLDKVNTPGQLMFALPVRGMASWRATLRRERKRVAYGDGVTRSAAIRDALGKL